MIKLYDAQLTDLLQNNGRYNPEIRSVAYAVLQEKRWLLDHADQTRTLAFVDELPEKILDVLAVELRTPAYDETFSIEVKRALIKGTIPYYQHLGTPTAVNWVVATLFGNGQIQEWFDYTERKGEPHHFRVTVRNDSSFRTLDGLVEFIRLIESVKRRSSWLDEIIVVTDLGPATLWMGGAYCWTVRVPLPEIPDIYNFEDTLHTGGAVGAAHILPLPELPDVFQFEDTIHTGGSMAAQTRQPLPEVADTFNFESAIQTGGRMTAQTRNPVPELADSFSFQSAIQTGGAMATNSRLNIPEITRAKPMTQTGRVGAQGAVNFVVPLPEIQ